MESHNGFPENLNQHGYQMPNGLQPPPIMNQPPQVFGQYDHEGLPMPGSLQDHSGMFVGGDGTFMDESSEAKRRRIARVSNIKPSIPRVLCVMETGRPFC